MQVSRTEEPGPGEEDGLQEPLEVERAWVVDDLLCIGLQQRLHCVICEHAWRFCMGLM
jgi:hypothetical protein